MGMATALPGTSSQISTTLTDRPPQYQQSNNFMAEPQTINVESPSQLRPAQQQAMPQMATVQGSAPMPPQGFASRQFSYGSMKDGDPMDQPQKQQTLPQGFTPQQSPTNYAFPSAPPQQFHSAVPLTALGGSPAPADCPMCRSRSMTLTRNQVGNTTHMWALILCFFTGHGCIPYLMSWSKDVRHTCSHCGTHLATWKRSGHTVVHAYH